MIKFVCLIALTASTSAVKLKSKKIQHEVDLIQTWVANHNAEAVHSSSGQSAMSSYGSYDTYADPYGGGYYAYDAYTGTYQLYATTDPYGGSYPSYDTYGGGYSSPYGGYGGSSYDTYGGGYGGSSSYGGGYSPYGGGYGSYGGGYGSYGGGYGSYGGGYGSYGGGSYDPYYAKYGSYKQYGSYDPYYSKYGSYNSYDTYSNGYSSYDPYAGSKPPFNATDFVNEVMQSLDANKDGKVTEEEFDNFVKQNIGKGEQQLKEGFKQTMAMLRKQMTMMKKMKGKMSNKLKNLKKDLYAAFKKVSGGKGYMTKDDLNANVDYLRNIGEKYNM